MSSMSELWSERSKLQWAMWFEAALARVQAELDIIPQSAANEINRKADIGLLSMDDLRTERTKVGHWMVAFLRVWTTIMEGGAGEHVHFGTTTADVGDTIFVLMLRESAKRFIEKLRYNEELMMELAHTYRATPMAGRTLGRHAVPITFGLKVASWLAENRRNIERLKSWLARTNTGIITGAAGSYAALGERAFEVEALTMRELGLGAPDPVDWKGTKDKWAEYGLILAQVSKSLARVGQEIFLLQSDDIREVSEITNQVGSSTMPHKENPIRAIRVIALSRIIPRLADVLLDWMVCIHERDQIQNEDILTEISVTTDSQIGYMSELLSNLRVHPENMLRNLDRTRGMIMAERLMMLLADKIGKQTAHELLNEICVSAWAKNQTLKEAVLAHESVARHFGPGELDRELDPARYVGLSPAAVDRTLRFVRETRGSDAA
jgi:adenylosuccinate lyase